MSQKGRLESIKNIIHREKKVIVTELSKQFDVTEETIRRDLDKLEEEGLVTRTYGGAVLNIDKLTEGIQYYKRATINVEAKKRIAKNVVKQIGDSLTIGLDSSTTAFEVACLLREREDITIITNSVPIMNELSQSKVNILSIGGMLNKNSLSLQGYVAKEALKNYNIDIAIISCKGISLEQGASDTDEMEADIKKEMLAHANSVILMADDSKFDKVAFVKIANLNVFSLIVTNRKPRQDWIDKLSLISTNILF